MDDRLWFRKKGAARSVAFHNVHDAKVLWLGYELPHQVDATVIRQGAVTQISTTDEASIERVCDVVETAPWVPVESETSGERKWRKFVNVDEVTDAVLEDDTPPPGAARRARKLVLSVSYVAPGNPFQPQSYVCGEIRDHRTIAQVLQRLGYPTHAGEIAEVAEVLVVEEEVLVEAPAAGRAKRKPRGA